ncbi:MAG TPA: beta-galactosidase [Prolixibacteraceae bacterium]|nr:beta-galactosidase [Prolixibacteraceae bacterium]
MNQKNFVFLILVLWATNQLVAQPYELDARVKPMEIRSSHLKIGGTNLLGESIDVNNYYLSINKKPFIPVTGEFHFSRYPNQYWEEAIRKMKAGGIDIIATYVFWNMHEELEGQFDWSGDNNLRKFIELCAVNQVKVVLRIGPFCHGEIRNGGLPDWLLGKPLSIRSNDPAYLTFVDRLYKQIGQQVDGLLYKDGGPIFAIQLENEYQHSASPWGLTYPGQPHDFTSSEHDRNVTQEGVGVATEKNLYAELGNQHMSVLKSLAEKNGLIVPIYTATGWGNAAVIENETLPVTAAYAYPGWAPASLSHFYLYTDLQKTPDYSPVRYKSEDYPCFAAEIGGGIMGTYTRRPVIPAKSLEALINRFLGSGANGLGYYMYHGGSTPKGKLFFFSDEAYGYPKISYDFQAPLSEYGKPVESFYRLKLFHFFLKAFGDILAPMQLILPENVATIKPEDVNALRYSMRVKDGSGFLFLNNFQDHQERKDISDIRFKIKLESKEIAVPEGAGFTLAKDESAILPVNLDLGEVKINYATAQLLTSGRDHDGEYFVFFAPEGISPEFSIPVKKGQTIQGENCTISKNQERWLVRTSGTEPSELKISQNNQITRFLILDKPSALNSWLISNENGTKLLISESLAMDTQNAIEFVSRSDNVIDFIVYPATDAKPLASSGKVTKLSKKNELFTRFQIEMPKQVLNFPVKHLNNKMVIDLSAGLPSGVNDVICRVNYKGDTGQDFINGELVADNFYNGIPWEIGLKRFLEKPDSKEMVFYFRPMYKDAEFLQDINPELIPEFNQRGQFLEIGEPEFFPEYRVKVSF